MLSNSGRVILLHKSTSAPSSQYCASACEDRHFGRNGLPLRMLRVTSACASFHSTPYQIHKSVDYLSASPLAAHIDAHGLPGMQRLAGFQSPRIAARSLQRRRRRPAHAKYINPSKPRFNSTSSAGQVSGASPPPWRPPTLLDEWVQKEARPISLKQLTFFGRTLTLERLLSSANYVRQELPVRIAHRLRDMQTLPYIVVSNPHISHVYERYYEAFETFRRVAPITTLAENDDFCVTVSRMLQEHLTVIPSLAVGVLECQGNMKAADTDRFVNRLLRARISRRVIAEQHLALTQTFRRQVERRGKGAKESPVRAEEAQEDAEGNFVGEVFLKCKAKDVVEKCAAVITSIARNAYGPDAKLPEIQVKGHLTATFPYILSHLEYIIGELLRNSMQASVERYAERNETPPPIEVLICEAPQFVIFRISDQGGGVPTETLPSLWSFSRGPGKQTRIENLSQVPKLEATMQELGREPGVNVHASKLSEGTGDLGDTSLTSLASRPPELRLGIGLPMSRVYAEYWAGSLSLQNLTGHGADVFLQISKLGNKNEQLTTRASMDAV